MKKIHFLPVVLLSCVLSTFYAKAQNEPYKNVSLPISERVDDLVSRMTVQEKILQMNYNAPAIERLGIPKYNWWNECLHGVARNGLATVFPQAVGLAATWDKNLMFQVASAISDEARAKYNDAVAHDKRGIYQGLTFWSPNINIFRDPRWGRGMETYGEDPYLTGQMAVQFIKGLQGNDPKYLKTVATAKHFAVHSGPEPDRHIFNAEISDYDLYDTYLPAFKMSVQEGNVQSLMCAYNQFRGNACCSNDSLLENILRNEWGFKGYVVSDCWAISDIYQSHKQEKDAAGASAVAVKAGTDLECGDSYPALAEAIQKGLVKETELDRSLKRLFEARFKLGMFDPPEMVPYSKIKMEIVDSKKNQQLALETARESIVLLKNQNNTLPLKKNVKTIAVIGPNANDEETLLANYNGAPSNPITPLKGIREKVGKGTKVIYERGCDVAENMPCTEVIPTEFLYTSVDKKENGLTAEYFDNHDLVGKPVLKKVDKVVDYKLLRDLKNVEEQNSSIRWSGYLIPSKSGEYNIGGYGYNGYKIFVEDSLFIEFYTWQHPIKIYKPINLEAGKKYKIRVEFYAKTHFAEMQLLWSVPDDKVEERAVEAAKKSDVVVMFMGLSPRLEGEEMNVPVKGFAGGDRLTLDLPEVQEKLIHKIVTLGKPVVLVLLNGSAVSINWENANVPAIVETWYGGQATGMAIADVLFGDYNPAGKLPVTFYKSVEQLPGFKDYNMRGRTYRYFDGEVLYPFGFGLSYTSFEIKNSRLSSSKFCNGDTLTLSVDVKNTGMNKGEEVVQLYLRGNPSTKNGAIKSLKGFERIKLKPNQAKTVTFKISSETLQEYVEGKGFGVKKGKHLLMVGSSSADPDMNEIQLMAE
ncbi:MAG: glycoside hydrolase family 3 C-terminal domain-containing protein [Ignavibacteriaceae bacterium]|jgi:beta-glucosidase